MILKKSGLNDVIVKRSITVKPTTTLLDAREILFKHKIRRLIVLDEKEKPVGIITEKDVAKAVYSLAGKPIKSVKVGDFMSKNLVTVKKNATVYDCAKLMKNRKEEVRLTSEILMDNRNQIEKLYDERLALAASLNEYQKNGNGMTQISENISFVMSKTIKNKILKCR